MVERYLILLFDYMKYYELTFSIEPQNEVAQDILSALLAEAGFETFVPQEDGSLKAYVQQALYSEEAVKSIEEEFPLPVIQLCHTLAEPEDKDWNETWEQEGFEPIIIDHRLAICDTHHGNVEAERRILIHPRQAFGTGSHQTTRMILSQLLEMPPKDKKVVDAGCGTGILGFLSLMLGAAKVLAYDIDEWSVNNTRDNALLNFTEKQAEDRLEVRLGDVNCIAEEKDYDVLIANINRNILLQDFSTFVKVRREKESRILLSGFYTSDIPLLLEEAIKHGFRMECQRTDEEWAMMVLRKG